MIIYPPEVHCSPGEVNLSARVEFTQPVQDIPDVLWFSYPSVYATAVMERADAFAAGLVLLAMHLGEDMEVRGVLSPKLVYGLQEYQRVFHSWRSDLFMPVNIRCDRLEPCESLPGAGVGLAFSGGIDSFYTLWRNLTSQQPLENYRITHCLFLHGFDVSLLHPGDFEAARASFETMLEPEGVELVPCRTNLRSFSEGKLPWFYAHSPALLAPVLGIGSLFRTFFIASSTHYTNFQKIGSSPVTDHLLSTESLWVIYHGTETVKPEKLKAIRDWPLAQQNLRVCIDAERRMGVQNCSRCFKCTRTRINLALIDSLEDFITLEPHLTLGQMLWWAIANELKGPWVGENIQLALERRKWLYGLLFWLADLSAWIKALARMLLPRPFFLWLRKRLYPPEKNPFLHSTVVSGSGRET